MRHFIVLALLLLVAGCGYQIVGMEADSKYRYYLAEISNESDDYTISDDVAAYVTRFFSDYSAIAPLDEADFVMRVTLTDRTVSTAIRSATREALSSNVSVRYHIVVEDKLGKVLYDRGIAYQQSFDSGTASSSYNRDEAEAFDECTINILTRFKYEFERVR
jgi:hypothetical protein